MRNKQPLTSKIIDLLSNFHLLSAGEIMALLKRDGLRYNKTSVYRALDTLVSEERLCKQLLEEAEAKYELHDKDHAHFICRKCGQVQSFSQHIDFSQPQLFIDHFHLTVFGLCQECH
ncbi:MAG: Fur family transcriptional regulator [Patescibacteria group bacterium]